MSAEQLKVPVFSDVYKHFIKDDLSLSAAYPVYSDNGELMGVLGVHMLLSDIDSYLEDIVLNTQGYAFIIENNTGQLIGNSLGVNNFEVLDDGALRCYTLSEINDPDIGEAGNTLIKTSSEILKQCCRENDLISRIGGDEFAILLPRKKSEDAERVISRIRAGFSNAHVAAIKCSISLGCETKTTIDESLKDKMSEAENAMYKDKTLNRKATNSAILDSIIQALHKKSPREEQHAKVVSELCEKVGATLSLSDSELSQLKRAGYLHDIGKITLDDSILLKAVLTEEEHEKMRQHVVVGYRILNLFDDTMDLAEVVYSHHEKWAGNGYPKELRGEKIPLLSRIISIVENYERALNTDSLTTDNKKAVDVIRNGSGTKFDPKIAELFLQVVETI